jgi:hypothetical protein
VLRRKGFVIAVFAVLGLLVLYNVLFFVNKKKARAALVARPAASASAERENSSPRATTDRGAAGEKPPSVVRVDFPPMSSEFGRDPFLLPIEEREGKSLRRILEEAEEAARRNRKTEDPEILKRLRALELSGILVCPAATPTASAAGPRRRRAGRLALIGRELVEEGGVLPEIGATVVRISATEVELRAGDVTHVLKLSPVSPLGLEVK